MPPNTSIAFWLGTGTVGHVIHALFSDALLTAGVTVNWNERMIN